MVPYHTIPQLHTNISNMRLRLASLLRLLFVCWMSCEAYSTAPVRSVVVVGGTHGNEYTGVWVIRQLEQAEKAGKLAEQYTTLDITTLLANPEAHRQNKRFIDDDLNRQFSAERLTAAKRKDPSSLPYEARRALELDALLGPKLADDDENSNNDNPKQDLIVDLHTTTANMGITIIIPESDAIMGQAAAYILLQCRQHYHQAKAQILMHPLPDRKHRPNLGSIAKHALTIEVGPVAQGVLRHDVVEQTNLALHALLEFLERRNRGQTEALLAKLQKAFPHHAVPCYRSAQAKRPGEMSGKVSWPSDENNPNFPALLVHRSIQDGDWKAIRKGDPIFVKLDGTEVAYDGSHDDVVHVMFVNEGG